MRRVLYLAFHGSPVLSSVYPKLCFGYTKVRTGPWKLEIWLRLLRR
jgi:hypothetical protein